MVEAATLRAQDLALAPGKQPLTQAVRSGEIVGLAGLDGHGQETFLKMLAGLEPPAGGAVVLDGVGGRSPIGSFRKAVAAGIAYLPRDRRATGIFPTQSVLDNFAISTVGRDARFGLISKAGRRKRYEAYRERLSIVAPRPDAAITTLSGGNQQKVLLARWLTPHTGLLLLDEPTHGVDIGAKAAVYQLVRQAVSSGMAVIVASSDTQELETLCDRVILLDRGSVLGELSGEDLTSERILSHLLRRQPPGKASA
jgi:ribose transport system ATP-binding protein